LILDVALEFPQAFKGEFTRETMLVEGIDEKMNMSGRLPASWPA